MIQTQCHLERFDSQGTQWQESLLVDESLLREFVSREKDAWSATFRLLGETQELHLSLSAGRATVLLIDGEDDFYDLVGRESERGWTQFVHGGQPADHPNRHVLTIDEAIQVASDFVANGCVKPIAPRWERQGFTQTGD